nr:MAG TPA: hypothetical protein [Caudoviricetes sp.]
MCSWASSLFRNTRGHNSENHILLSFQLHNNSIA